MGKTIGFTSDSEMWAQLRDWRFALHWLKIREFHEKGKKTFGIVNIPMGMLASKLETSAGE